MDVYHPFESNVFLLLYDLLNLSGSMLINFYKLLDTYFLKFKSFK